MDKQEQPEKVKDKTESLHSEKVQKDGKIFYVDAIQNSRGKGLRITEIAQGKRSAVIIPSSMVAELERMWQASATALLR